MVACAIMRFITVNRNIFVVIASVAVVAIAATFGWLFGQGNNASFESLISNAKLQTLQTITDLSCSAAVIEENTSSDQNEIFFVSCGGVL